MKRMHDGYAFDSAFIQGDVRYVVGVDEAGRGALAGPLVAAAVLLCSEQRIEDLDDSKRLSEKRREQVGSVIMARATAVGIGLVDASTIDRRGIEWANRMVMTRAMRALQPPAHVPMTRQNTIVLVDGTKRAYRSPWNQHTVRGGDGLSAAIAAASIVAKTHRDHICTTIMHEQYPHYGFAQHKAYGTAAHYEALAAWGPCPFHRRSFRLA